MRLIAMLGDLLCAGALSASCSSIVRADEFYRGKTINLYIGFAPGGSYDYYARVVARHLGKHLPGNPVVVPQSMPGAGSLRAANFLYSAAPKDGTAIGIVTQTLPLEETLENSSAKYKTSAFNWIGRMTHVADVALAWHDSPVKSVADLRTRDATMATTGPGSTTYGFPKLLNDLAGTRFKLVSGYPGSTDAMLAMERGETDSSSTSWNTLRTAKAAWLKNKLVNVLLLYSRSRLAALPDVPAAPELGRTEEDRKMLEFYASSADVGRSLIAPPGLPDERVRDLRQAFSATMSDPELISELEQAGADLAPLSGEEMQKLVATLPKLPDSGIRRMEAILSSSR